MNAMASGCLAGLIHDLIADAGNTPSLWRGGLSAFFGLICAFLSVRLRKRVNPDATNVFPGRDRDRSDRRLVAAQQGVQ